jgi:hypothetical protein
LGLNAVGEQRRIQPGRPHDRGGRLWCLPKWWLPCVRGVGAAAVER